MNHISLRRALARPSPAIWGVIALSTLASPAFAQPVPDYPGAEDLPEIRLTDTELSGPSSQGGEATKAFVDYVTQASKGNIQIEVFWAGSLMPILEAPEGIATGAVDMGATLPVYTPAQFPVTNWLNTLSNQLKGGQPYGKLVASSANAEFHVLNEDIRKEYEDQGIHILGASGGTAYDLLCTKEVKDLATAKAVRTRSANQAFAKELDAMGMTPVSIVANEIYEAFQRGIIECIILFPSANVDLGLTDVPGQKYWINLDLGGWMASLHLFNKAKWDSLPPLAQQILTDGYTRYIMKDAELTYVNGTRKFGDLIKKGEIIPVQPEADILDALHAHQQREIENMVASAPAGVQDARATIDLYLATLDKWRKIVGEDLGIQDTPKLAGEIVDAWYTEYDFGPYQTRLAEELGKAREAAKQ